MQMTNRKPLLANQKLCTGCLVCVDSCGHGALNHYIGEDGHYYIRIDNEKCVGCLVCERTCPIMSKQQYSKSEIATFYAAWNKNDEARLQSASGGAFSAMARYILDQGGFVIGAINENVCDVKHVAISDTTELYKIQGSKYTQSNTNGIYRQALNLLKDGEIVLFSGTGCQIGGLLSFLKNKTYTGRLITIDLICGGVPSRLLLKKFIDNEPYRIQKILSYRTKDNGWKPSGFVYNMKIEDTERNIHDYTGKCNFVTASFSVEMTERYSCYNCKFVGKKRLSDYTIGDLWGDKDFPKEHYKGLSLVIAHNKKADDMLKSMQSYLQTELCDENRATKINFRLVNGHNVKQYTLERKYLSSLFKRCSYNTLKKIYANDYKTFSPWMLLKIVRKIYLSFFKIIHL